MQASTKLMEEMVLNLQLQKGKRISTTVMEAWHYGHLRNGPTCKEKWKAIFSDFKRINDYHKGTWHNEEYWDVSLQDRGQWNCPRQFSHEVYEMIDGFKGHKLLFAPRHSQDLMSAQDTVYTPRIQMTLKVLKSWIPHTSLVLNQVMIHFSPHEELQCLHIHHSRTITNSVHTSSICSFTGFNFFTTSKLLYGKHRTKAQSFIIEYQAC